MADLGSKKPAARIRSTVLLVAGLMLGIVSLPFTMQSCNHGAPAHRSSLETNAIGALRVYCEAQRLYREHDWDGDGELEYAHPFPVLNTWKDGSGQPIQLIDGAFAQATSENTPKHGYFFADMASIAGTPVNWHEDFALCAMPAVYGRTGFSIFIVKTDGRVWGRDFGGSGFVADFPAAPEAEGWADPEAQDYRRRLKEKTVAVLSSMAVAGLAGLLIWGLAWVHRSPTRLAVRIVLTCLTIAAVLGLLLLTGRILVDGLHDCR